MVQDHIRRLICWLKGHVWSDWSVANIFTKQRYRYCERCRKTEHTAPYHWAFFKVGETYTIPKYSELGDY